jgi:glycosyltransferase involved in cell wall biosynthesis
MNPYINIIHSKILVEKTVFHRWVNTYILFGWRLFKVLNQGNYDIILSGYEYDSELPVLQARFLRIFNKSREHFISIIQNTLYDHSKKYYSKRNTIILDCITALRFILFDHVIVVAPGLICESDLSHGKKTTIIPNPVNSIEVQAQATMSVKDNVFPHFSTSYFLNVARIASQKNQLMLLKAFNEIRDKTVSNIVIIGEITDIEYYQRLKQYIKDKSLVNRVFIIQPQPNHFPFVSRAKALVVPSLYEGVPLVILEAMVLHKTIISTKYDGHESLLNTTNSILVDKNDFVGLASAIWQVDTDAIKCNTLQETAGINVMHYDINIIGKKYYDLFTMMARG